MNAPTYEDGETAGEDNDEVGRNEVEPGHAPHRRRDKRRVEKIDRIRCIAEHGEGPSPRIDLQRAPHDQGGGYTQRYHPEPSIHARQEILLATERGPIQRRAENKNGYTDRNSPDGPGNGFRMSKSDAEKKLQNDRISDKGRDRTLPEQKRQEKRDQDKPDRPSAPNHEREAHVKQHFKTQCPANR